MLREPALSAAPRRRRCSVRRGAAALAATVVAAAVAIATGASAIAEPSTLADAVKAAYLYKFEAFVEWPPTAFASPASPFELCIIADATFAALLENAVRGEHVGMRGFTVRRIGGTGNVDGCQVVYIEAGDDREAAAVLDALRGQPVLTVTDADRGPKGIINFVLRDNHVRFEIDAAAAARNGLAISSKLLSLAVSVKPKA